ncbi:hypothetical protein LPJ61_001422 [Coemansia biformis]|uniref:Uncharacterized protein n=1 Tax=Coemansia biformis TaxID=1286918 RepID=A0A9W7YGR5_9FUNG|nr:hypothetical protein LPJ61_001422 [Coemansia biformis]
MPNATAAGELKKIFDSMCAVPGSVGAVMIREDGSIARASGKLSKSSEAVALSHLVKDAAQLMAMLQPEAGPLTRVTISRQNDVAIAATTLQGYVFGVKLAGR